MPTLIILYNTLGLLNPVGRANGLVVEIAFATNPGSPAPTWVDVSAYVRTASTRRGRQHELDRTDSGTATLTLLNSDGRFDPTNAAGPYYPNVLPMRRIRISYSYSSILYPIFSGFIESWPQTWAGNNVGFVTITASDGLKVLGLKSIDNSYPAERSDQRIGRVLDDAGWSTADRSLSTGISSLTSATLANTNALAHAQQVELTENGRFFISASGGAFFQDRHTPFNSTASLSTFGDIGTTAELSYEDIVVAYDDARIYNDVHVTRDGGIEQNAADTATSQARYFPRSLVRTGLLVPDDNETAAAAVYLLSNYKDPALRMESIEIVPGSDPANLYPAVLARELGDRVMIKRRPPAGNTISQQSFIEGIEWNFAVATLPKLVWRLAAVGIGYGVGSPIIVGHATAGRLTSGTGQTTGVLVY